MSQLPPSLPGIDVASGLARVIGNEKLYIQMLRRVAGTAAETIEKINSAVAAENTHVVREVAHAIRGVSANLSMTDVAAAAEKLESAATARDLSVLPDCAAGFINAMNAFSRVVDRSFPDIKI